MRKVRYLHVRRNGNGLEPTQPYWCNRVRVRKACCHLVECGSFQTPQRSHQSRHPIHGHVLHQWCGSVSTVGRDIAIGILDGRCGPNHPGWLGCWTARMGTEDRPACEGQLGKQSRVNQGECCGTHGAEAIKVNAAALMAPRQSR